MTILWGLRRVRISFLPQEPPSYIWDTDKEDKYLNVSEGRRAFCRNE